MKTFLQFLEATNHLDIGAIKSIIFNALGISENSDFLDTNLGDFDNRKQILNNQIIRKMPNFDVIKQIITVDFQKYTLGLLASKILQLNNTTLSGE